MSFSYKTENLGLPVWGSNDKPTQDDLNYQNHQIDKKFNNAPYNDTTTLQHVYGDILSLFIDEKLTTPTNNIYTLRMKDQYNKNTFLNINCGVIVGTYYGTYSTDIYFIPFDWFSGNIDDIKVECITKEGE